jgi:hypothetical protein
MPNVSGREMSGFCCRHFADRPGADYRGAGGSRFAPAPLPPLSSLGNFSNWAMLQPHFCGLIGATIGIFGRSAAGVFMRDRFEPPKNPGCWREVQRLHLRLILRFD